MASERTEFEAWRERLAACTTLGQERERARQAGVRERERQERARASEQGASGKSMCVDFDTWADTWARARREHELAYGSGDVVKPRTSNLVACKAEARPSRKRPHERAFKPVPNRKGKRKRASAWYWDIECVAKNLERAIG